LSLLRATTFRTEKLLALQRQLGDGRAAKSLRTAGETDERLAQCENPWFDLFAQALAARTQLCFAIEKWKLLHGGHLEEWLHAWGEFEALASISGYAFEHPDDALPVFEEGGAVFRATGLGHPLIPAADCVRNDVALDAANRFYVVSGSNMAGKSTLLRSQSD
jgi:DNA mismatch repair ATPase MutS